MNLMKLFKLYGWVAFCLGGHLFAQNAFDAYRYSNFEINSTARTVGVGGALGALGTDFAVMSTNPAGISLNRKSVFTISPSIAINNTNSWLSNDPQGLTSSETASNLNLSNFGIIVFSDPKSDKWSSFNFGMGMNRLQNFNQNFFFDGSSPGSITDQFVEEANSSTNYNPFGAGVAIDAEAVYDLDEDGTFETDYFLATGEPVYRQQFVTREGSINELTFAFAGNFQERFMVGLSVGIPFLNFTQTKTYAEEDLGEGTAGNVPYFDNLAYREYLSTTGTGVNFKLGMIFRPIHELRLGLSAHTPTFFSLEDNFTSSMSYQYTLEDGDVVEAAGESPDGYFNYKLSTPWRFSGSAAVIINKFGFISGEIEYVDYGNAAFNYDNFAAEEREVNNAILTTFKPVLNIRAGAEIVYDILRFRGGAAFLPSAIDGDNTINHTWSIGAGIVQQAYFLDLAYRFGKIQNTYLPYNTTDGFNQLVDNDVSVSKLLMTVGFRF